MKRYTMLALGALCVVFLLLGGCTEKVELEEVNATLGEELMEMPMDTPFDEDVYNKWVAKVLINVRCGR